MSSSYYDGRARQYRRDLERELKKRADAETKAAKADEAASKAEASASRAASPSSASSKAREAERKRRDATNARKDAAKASTKAADLQKKIHEAEKKAREANDREQASEKRKLAAKQRSEEWHERLREQRRANEEVARDVAREREVTELNERTQALEEQLRQAQQNAPNEITVLFMAGTIEGGESPLRLDQEVREIQKRIRESEHRDAIKVEHRLATRVTDILQALNEVKPDVVHFSGHGNEGELLFEGNDGKPLPLSNEQLGLLLQASANPIRLALFNSCESGVQAALACEFVSAAIGMDESVADASAKEFAGQLYSSIGFGLDLAIAFAQAKAHAFAAGSSTGEPRLYTADGVVAENIVLVAPSELPASPTQ